MPTKRPARKPARRAPARRTPKAAAPVKSPAPERVDGRSRRATGRNLRFGATVHPDWKVQLDRLADRLGAGTLYVHVLERALDALERELDQEEEEPSPRETKQRARGKPARRR